MPVAVAHEPEVIRRRLLGEGPTEIANALGVTSPAVAQTLALPHIRAAIDRANAEMLQALMDAMGRARTEAFDALRSQLHSEDERIVQGAANSILDRTGLPKGTTLHLPDGGGVGVLALVGLSPAQLRAVAWGEEEAESNVIHLPALPPPDEP